MSKGSCEYDATRRGLPEDAEVSPTLAYDETLFMRVACREGSMDMLPGKPLWCDVAYRL